MIRLGSIIAWLLVISGGIPVAFGFLFLFGGTPEDGAALARNYFNEPTNGAMIDRGSMYILIGVLVGLLARIAKNTTKT